MRAVVLRANWVHNEMRFIWTYLNFLLIDFNILAYVLKLLSRELAALVLVVNAHVSEQCPVISIKSFIRNGLFEFFPMITNIVRK